jgi:hypothetical protein
MSFGGGPVAISALKPTVARLVLTQILELADELGRGTIERQLAKSDLEIGLEYLLRSSPRA